MPTTLAPIKMEIFAVFLEVGRLQQRFQPLRNVPDLVYN